MKLVLLENSFSFAEMNRPYVCLFFHQPNKAQG